MTPLLVNDIYDYALTRIMQLNPKKCKEMIINFLQNRLPFQDTLQVGGNTIERVSSYKLLRVYLQSDLYIVIILQKKPIRDPILYVYYGELGLDINSLYQYIAA